MRKLVLFIFAAVVAVNMVGCRMIGPSIYPPGGDTDPVAIVVGLVAMDKDNNDLLDTTKVSPIDLKKVQIYGDRCFLFDGAKLPSSDYKIIPVKIGQTTVSSNSISTYVAVGDKSPLELDGGSIVSWGFGNFDTLQAKDLGGGRMQLFHNKKLVWDNKDDVSVKHTTYIRRFE